MFKDIYNPTQKKCYVPQNQGYDTKSLCSEHTYFNHSILRRKNWLSKANFIIQTFLCPKSFVR